MIIKVRRKLAFEKDEPCLNGEIKYEDLILSNVEEVRISYRGLKFENKVTKLKYMLKGELDYREVDADYAYLMNDEGKTIEAINLM